MPPTDRGLVANARSPPGRWLVFVALAIAMMTLAISTLAPPKSSGQVVASSEFGGSADVTCSFAAHPSCLVAPAGTSWTSLPPTNWCTVTGGTLESSPNGTFPSETYSCAIGAVVLSFLTAAPATLSGIVNVSGPAQLWVEPSAIDCSLFAATHSAAVPCAPPFGYVPPYSWNASTTRGGLLNLADLPFNLGKGPGVLPPGSAWSLCFVNLVAENETVSVDDSISLNPLA